MPRHYQLKSCEFILPHNVYMQVLYIIRDYDRQKELREQILHGSPTADGMPKGSDISNPTAVKGEKLAQLANKEIQAIDEACEEMRDRYADRNGGFKPLDAFWNYAYFSCLSSRDGYAEKTWRRYRQRFAYTVAKKLNKI